MVNKLLILSMVLGSIVFAESGITPANQWACRVECGEVPADYTNLNNGTAELKTASLVVKAQKRLISGPHVAESCGGLQGYENCYLVSKSSNLPPGFHFDSDASAFNVHLPRAH